MTAAAQTAVRVVNGITPVFTVSQDSTAGLVPATDYHRSSARTAVRSHRLPTAKVVFSQLCSHHRQRVSNSNVQVGHLPFTAKP